MSVLCGKKTVTVIRQDHFLNQYIVDKCILTDCDTIIIIVYSGMPTVIAYDDSVSSTHNNKALTRLHGLFICIFIRATQKMSNR